MNISDYWSTLVAIVLGLAMAELLLNLHRLIDARKRIAWDPLPLLWALIVLLWLFNYWWAVGMNLDGSRDAVVVGSFVLLAIAPILLFLMAASVLPRIQAAEGPFDMRADWLDRRNVFLTLFALHQSVVWVTIIVTRNAVPWDLPSILRTLALSLLLALLFFKSRLLEWAAVLVILVLVVLRLSLQAIH